MRIEAIDKGVLAVSFDTIDEVLTTLEDVKTKLFWEYVFSGIDCPPECQIDVSQAVKVIKKEFEKIKKLQKEKQQDD